MEVTEEEEGGEKVGVDNSNSNHHSSSNCPTLNISSSTKIGGKKYFVTACLPNSKLFTAFCDSGADVSAVSPKMVAGLPLIELEEPLVVKGFDGNRTTAITHKVELELNFHPGGLKDYFYVCDVPHAIIGNDILQNDEHHLSLETGKKFFHIGSDIIFTKSSPFLSISEYKRRRLSSVSSYRRAYKHHCHGRNWVRLLQDYRLEPNSITIVEGYVDNYFADAQSFLSLYDGSYLNAADCGHIYIPSLSFPDGREKASNGHDTPLLIPVANNLTEAKTMSTLTILGEMVRHSTDSQQYDAECYDMRELLEEIERRELVSGEDMTCKYGITSPYDVCNIDTDEFSNVNNPTTPTNQPNQPTTPTNHPNQPTTLPTNQNFTPAFSSDINHPQYTPPSSPVPFSSLVGKNKVGDDVLDRCRRDGIDFDLQLDDKNGPDVEMEILEDIDIEAERKKADDCPYWKDEDSFFSEFNFKDLAQEHLDPLKELLFSFRHIFDSSDPAQFRQGINMKPIEIKLKPGMTPKKHKLRRLSDEKIRHLKIHLKTLLDQGVIAELDSSADVYASPLHLVVEQRFVSSRNAVVEKSRVTADQRQLNACLADSSFPLPNCNEYREKVGKMGYTTFSNFDCSSFFHQFPVSKESSKLLGIHAINKIYCYLRLSQGLKLSPPIVQNFISKAMRCHERVFPFIDDCSVASENVQQHLYEDLPKFFALCSYYRILLKPSKADMVRKSTRVLGFQIGESQLSISKEKEVKISDLKFPVTKDECIARLAFLQYFNGVAPKLSEHLAPLRRLTKLKVRYTPTDLHREAFDKAITHLQDKKVNVIRLPSSDPSDQFVLWTDASSNSISCLLTQYMLPPSSAPDNDGKRRLYVVGCFSSVIKDSWLNFPIWLLELISLYEATRKFRHLLSAKAFWVVVDSSTVANWASLEGIPKDLARKILHIQKFQANIVFVESRLQAADPFSRLESLPAPSGTYPKFLKERIYNAHGQKVPWQSLFSQRKHDEMIAFFHRHRRQPLSYAVDGPLEEEEEEEEEDDYASRPDGEYTIVVDDLPATPPEVTPIAGAIPAIHTSICAISLDDDDLNAGRVEEDDDSPPDSDVMDSIKLPRFSGSRLDFVRRLQAGDDILDRCRDFLMGTTPLPNKAEALLLPAPLQDFLRHRSLFRLTDQNILIRFWLNPLGIVDPLIMVGSNEFLKLVGETHSFNSPSSSGHIGQRKTMDSLKRQYYSFNMRRVINSYVRACSACVLNNHPTCRKEDDGNKIATEPLSTVEVDVCGPWNNFKTTSGRTPSYFVAIDAASRFAFTSTIYSTSDAEILRCFLDMRRHFSGLPSKIQCDNGLLKENSRAKQFLISHHVSITHGHAYVSRSQSRAEKTIGTISRLIVKYSTECPKIAFPRLLEESTLTYNASPCDALPMNLSPRDLFYVRPPTSFLRSASDEVVDGVAKSLVDCVAAARAAGAASLQNDVAAFIRRQKKRSPTNYTRRLKSGDCVLKKRSVWPVGTPKKYGHRVVVDGFVVEERVATNAFKVRSVVTDEHQILPGDVLIKTKLTEDELRRLVDSMNVSLELSEPEIEPALTRSRARALNDDASVNSVEKLFIHHSGKNNYSLDSLADFGISDLWV